MPLRNLERIDPGDLEEIRARGRALRKRFKAWRPRVVRAPGGPATPSPGADVAERRSPTAARAGVAALEDAPNET